MKIDAIEYGNIIRFINHSNNPNCQFKRLYHCGINHIICVSLTDVLSDQQLTVDYGSSYWNNRELKPSNI
jgi:SET domain-containing protein